MRSYTSKKHFVQYGLDHRLDLYLMVCQHDQRMLLIFSESAGQTFCLYSLYISLNGIKYCHPFVEEVFLVHVITKYLRLATLLSSLIARWWVVLRTLYDGSKLGTCLLLGWLLLAVVWPARVCLLDFVCSGVRFCLLLCSCLCFVSFLYLGLYVLEDDALMSCCFFIQTKNLCVLIRIWAGGRVGAPLGRFKFSSEVFLLAFPGRCFFC